MRPGGGSALIHLFFVVEVMRIQLSAQFTSFPMLCFKKLCIIAKGNDIFNPNSVVVVGAKMKLHAF